nr:reverse transcriptase domain-containing protein [Tanacetum cinerariifolium]
MQHMKEDETIDTFTKKLTILVNKAASLGHTMEDETLVRKLLNAVPDSPPHRRKDVHTRLDFREGPRERTREDSHNSSPRARTTKPELVKVQDHLRYGDHHVLDRLGHRRQSAFERLSETYSPSTTKSRPWETDSRDPPWGRSRTYSLNTLREDRSKDRERFRSIRESYDDPFSHCYRDGNRSYHMKRRRDNESLLSNMSRSESSNGSIKGALECMRISRFMHVVNKPKLTKRLNEHVRKTMEEMMITTTAFIRGEAAASKKKRHASWKARDYDNIADLFYRQNYMAAGTTKAPSDHMRHQSFHKSMDEFHDYKVIVTLQRTILIPTKCTSVITSSAVSREERTRPANFKVALHPDFPDLEVAIRGTLSDKGCTELCSILKKNLDIFAWQPSDMTGVPRWQMCVDFTNLNKACPQDCYPIPKINWKVKSLCGYPFRCFLDDYKGYNQIQLAELDEEKTTFHIGQGVYCSKKMPFGLKNADATYQRLMDKAFERQIGWNIKVYVDDLVVKSYTEAEMMRDIVETFRTLRKVNMKLNPKKCSFGLAKEMFLGYVVTPEEIKLSPDKTTAVLQLP